MYGLKGVDGNGPAVTLIPRHNLPMRSLRLILLFAVSCAGQDASPIVIDTDAGSDDLMAIAFLLARGAPVAGITVVNGLAHVPSGVANIEHLVGLSNSRSIPVFGGREMPLSGSAEFPKAWREQSDRLLTGKRRPHAGAARFLASQKRIRILALGPLTNLAEALGLDPALARRVEELVIMGGAVRVPGNLGDGGYFKTDNTWAEWNIFVDPIAARKVFQAGMKIRLVPLDATNKAPLSVQFLNDFVKRARTPLAKAVAKILEASREHIERGIFYAWDPLAAVALIEPGVVKTTPLALEIRAGGPQAGRTVEISGGKPNAAVALDADSSSFHRIYLEALTGAR